MECICYNCMETIKPDVDKCPCCGKSLHFEVPAHQLKPGTLLQNRYLVGKALGQGGFGITYIGKDTTLNMRVAIKEYYPNGYSNRNHDVTDNVTITASDRDVFFHNGKQKFLYEARILAMFCGEPGIVSVRDFFETNNTAYIVMEYINGVTLKKYVTKKGPLSAHIVFHIMQPVLKALAKVHEQGVVHRDISPDNIMVVSDGTLKLLDFGSAREVGGDKSLSVMLKPGYAPEEQYRSSGKQGPWTDVYALCATMYFCLTGRAPEESIERIWSGNTNTPAPSECGADTIQWQDTIIMRGLSVRAEDRFQSVKDLAEAMSAKPSDTYQHDYTVYSDTDKTIYQNEERHHEAEKNRDESQFATVAKPSAFEEIDYSEDVDKSIDKDGDRGDSEEQTKPSLGETKKRNKLVVLLAAICLLATIGGLLTRSVIHNKDDEVGIYTVTLTAVSDSKIYDGTPLVNTTVKSSKLASDDHTMTADYTVYDDQGNALEGDPTDIGVYTKKVSNVQIWNGKKEITKQYQITTVDGYLTITAPELIIAPSPTYAEEFEPTPTPEDEHLSSESIVSNSDLRPMGPFSPGRFYFVNGASVQIPEGFSDTNISGDYHSDKNTDGYIYVFLNPEYDMTITLSEDYISTYRKTGKYGTTNYELLSTLREELIDVRGTPSWRSLYPEYFKLTGYMGDSIYYTYGVIDNDILYIIDFFYPGSNSKYCDRIVETTEASFSGADSSPKTVISALGRPSSADLDAINADIVYPHNAEMYLPFYKSAKVCPSPGKTAVYAFKDPDNKNDPMRSSNYYTVSRDTEVTVLAESLGYSCVIINDSQKAGWINSKYLVEIS